jgi:hypothetical protein
MSASDPKRVFAVRDYKAKQAAAKTPASAKMSAVHAEVAACWGSQTTNIRYHNQDQHPERGHRELRSNDEKSSIKF